MMSQQQDQTKVVLITGGSNGIGEATAIEYAKLGYRVTITGRNQDRLDQVIEQLASESPIKTTNKDNFLAIKADFEIEEEVDSVVEKTVAKFGRLDYLINNAGFRGQKLHLDHPDFYKDFQSILQVNLVSAVRIAQLAVPYIKQTKGVIVNVSSISDRLAGPTVSYSVAKAGLSMLTKTLANALDRTGVRVITVAPGPVRTNFGPGLELMAPLSSLNRIADSKEIADTIVFLTSDKASYIHGTTIDVDGGSCTRFVGALNKLAKGIALE